MSLPFFDGNAGWLRVTTWTWVLLVSVLTVGNSAALFHVARVLQQEDVAGPNDALSRQVEGLDKRVRAVELMQKQPREVDTGEYRDELIVLRQRLDSIEQALPGSAIQSDAPALYARMEHLESRVGKLQRAPRAARKPVAPPKPAQPQHDEPPFVALGVELRGGERFVTVGPRNGTSLSQLRLLRVGESEAGWRLDAVTRDRAVFRSNDQVHSFTLQ